MAISTNQFISVRETAQILAISEKKVMDLIEQGKLQAYRIAEKFLRLKKIEVLNLRDTGNIAREISQHSYTPSEKIKDIFYFNDFYIFSCAVIIMLLYVILYT
jgi:excisionase family DNA binding protein